MDTFSKSGLFNVSLNASYLMPAINEREWEKTYSLEQIAEAHAYVEKGHKKGNVVIEL